jgi:hypothetical protein
MGEAMTVIDDVAVSRGDWYMTEPTYGESSAAYVADVEITGGRRVSVTPEWLTEVSRRLRELEELPANWDGYGALPVRPVLTRAVSRLVALPIWFGTPRPEVLGTADGGVSVEWRRGPLRLELEISPTGSIDLYVADEANSFEWEGPLGDEPDGLDKWAWRLSQAG